MPSKYQKVSKRWQESDVQTALNLINEWKSIRSTADVFGMSESMLRKQIAKKKRRSRKFVHLKFFNGNKA